MSKKELPIADQVIRLIDNPSEVLDYTDKWWSEACILVDNMGGDLPLIEFLDITTVLIAWADHNHIDGVGCLWDLHTQIFADSKSGPPSEFRQPDGEIEDALVKASCAIQRIGVAAMIACKLSSKDENNIDDNQRIKSAIAKHGKDAKPDTIIKEAQINKQSGRLLLRMLEHEGKYSGFARDKPDRYKSTYKRFSVPER